MKKFLSLLLAAATILVSASACSSTTATSSAAAPAPSGETGSSETSAAPEKVTGSITASGSSALYPLVNDAKNKFKSINPDVSITLNGGGSGTGLKQVSDGSVDIGNSDVEAASKLAADKAKELVDHKICVITMAPIVNKDVAAKVKSLTTEQLVSIFTAKTKNWKEVGGPDEPIVLVTRPATSGTRALFKQYALNNQEEASNASLETDDSGALLQSVSTHKGAIGYVALSYLINNTSVSTIAIDNVEPTLENTYNGTYKVWGYEHMYTKGEPEGAVKAFLDYMQSEEYGNSVETLGYNVTSKMKATK
jgi:phosphate transport system substrate-binding protein